MKKLLLLILSLSFFTFGCELNPDSNSNHEISVNSAVSTTIQPETIEEDEFTYDKKTFLLEDEFVEIDFPNTLDTTTRKTHTTRSKPHRNGKSGGNEIAGDTDGTVDNVAIDSSPDN
ncbi:MAG: hypothetical protein DWQ06_05180 [Calditrichaeota bacterium]|nr:MAG: hypothetical protein DWQ06_05180 [Calditrichota bacterium]